MNINIFYRKKLKEHHSIEKVYDTLLPYFKEFNVVTKQVPYQSRGIVNRILNIIYAKFHQTNINHISGDINYVNFFLKKRNTILTIHDVYPLIRSKGFKRTLLKLLWFTIPIKRAQKIVTVSEFSKSEIIKHFNISSSKIQIISNCVSPQFKTKTRSFNTNQPTILHIGSKRNKNLNHLIESIIGLPVKLTIVGEIKKSQKEKLIKHCIAYEDYQNLTDIQLVELYQKSDIVSFISTYEGFGLPIIEAQAVGRVVITSNLASMPEVAGHGALLVNPYSVKEIREGILQLMRNKELRDSLINKGFENVKRFKPQNIAKEYVHLYRTFLRRK